MKLFKRLLSLLRRRKRLNPELVYGAMKSVPQVGPMVGLARAVTFPTSWAEPAKDDKK